MPFSFSNCEKCSNQKTDFAWCHQCDTQALVDAFPTWTSGNLQVDDAIRRTQRECRRYFDYLEFIPYDRFSKIEKIGEGAFGTVSKAYWSDGERCYYRKAGDQYFLSTEGDLKRVNPVDDRLLCAKSRTEPIPVVLKFLLNSKNISKEFLDEIMAFYGCFNNKFSTFCLKCHGVTCHPVTKNFGMVFPYVSEGNLREYLKENYSKLSWVDKIDIIHEFERNLVIIHDEGFIHGDIHSGNILIRTPTKVFITDLGLARPADRPELDRKGVYGIISYMAPEILLSQPKTQASDVYAFGMVLFEICSGKAPFYDQNCDGFLAHKIVIKDLRPVPEDGTPRCIVDLMKQCWDPDPSKRPSFQQIHKIVGSWIIATTFENLELYEVEDTTVNLKQIREDIDQAEQKRLNSNFTVANSQADPYPEIYTRSQYVTYSQIIDDSNNSTDSFWSLKIKLDE